MLTTMLNLIQSAAEFSLLGCFEVASVALIIYYIYTKTRAPAIIAGLFPHLNLNINYRSSLVKFNSMGNELLTTLRSSTKSETKKKDSLSQVADTQNMLMLTPHAGRKPYGSFYDWGSYFTYVAQAIRSKKYQYPQVLGFVQKDPVLQRAIKQASEQIFREQQVLKVSRELNILHDVDIDSGEIDNEDDSMGYNEIVKSQEKRAKSILMDMSSTLNNFLLSLTSWLLYKLLPCFLSGVVTHTKQIEMLQTASKRAPGIPLIFLPLHRSHLDYIMVTFILTNNDIRSPLVAAGNNLQIPVFGRLLRGLGAFFIKRKIDPIVGKKDVLYRAILHLYLQHSLKMGHNVEFFIEGGRTRTGKPCMPKGGILSVIVNAFMDNSISDALLVPVSVNYERLVDGNFVREQKGEKKVPETFKKAMLGIWKALNSNYGLMRIDFNEPYSLRELVLSYNKIAKNDGNNKLYSPSSRTLQHNQSTSSLYGTDVVCEEHRALIESISRQVVYDCAAATSVMSTNALAFLLLTRFRKGAPIKDFASELTKLRHALKGRRDVGFAGDSMHIINYACDLLGKGLVKRASDEHGQIIIEPVQSVETFIELAYYSNMLAPHFALKSILMITFHLLLPKDAENNLKESAAGVSRRKLIEKAVEYCDVYRYEFILHKPTQVLDNLLEINLDDLILNQLLKLLEDSHEVVSAMDKQRARNMASHLDDLDNYSDDISFESTEEPDLFYCKETIVEQKALCEILAPFAHSYNAVAQNLIILYKHTMLETEFIKFVINNLSNQYENGFCPYAESISTDSVRNCLKLLEKWSVIEISSGHGLRQLSLGTPYESKEALKSIVDRITGMMPNYKNGYF